MSYCFVMADLGVSLCTSDIFVVRGLTCALSLLLLSLSLSFRSGTISTDASPDSTRGIRQWSIHRWRIIWCVFCYREDS